MTRSDAIQRFTDIAKEEWDITEPDVTLLPEFKFINEIYDSIGTCGECDRWDELRDGYGTCFTGDETELWHEDEFCSRFERKV